jgi:hypothetical protein
MTALEPWALFLRKQIMPDIAGHPPTPQSLLPLVVDASVNCEEAAQDIADRGVKVVMRYYARVNGGQNDPPADPSGKRLSKSEAAAIHEAKMAIGLVYQRNNRAIEGFTVPEANLAADYCINRDLGLHPKNAEAIEHPKGTVIYFGVDTGDFNDDQFKIVVTYFNTITKRFKDAGAPFLVGVYGSGKSCDQLHDEAGINNFWLAGVSAGWDGTRDFYGRPLANWNLFQNALEVPVAGVSVDTNLVNPNVKGKLGAFGRDGLIGSLDDSAVRAKLRFTKASPPPALFFETPGGTPIIHKVKVGPEGHEVLVSRNFIEPSRMVSLLEEGPVWSKVEVVFVLDNEGTVYQGYVHSNILAPIDKMP